MMWEGRLMPRRPLRPLYSSAVFNDDDEEEEVADENEYVKCAGRMSTPISL